MTPPLLRRLLKDRADGTLIQFIRYTFVGGAAFCVDFGSLWALTEFLHIHYLASAAAAFAAGLTTNYLLSIRWVFSSRTMASRWGEFLVFSLVGIAGLGINELVMWACTDRAGLHYLQSKVVSTLVVLAWNFSARKLLLFR